MHSLPRSIERHRQPRKGKKKIANYTLLPYTFPRTNSLRMQAIILAAGMGKRLGELTKGNTKCMVKVNGVTLAERLLHQLENTSTPLSRIVIVTGYEGKKLQDYISTLNISVPIEYVENPVYATTNNIYSLYLAKDYLCEDDTLLFESDLIFDASLIERLISDSYPSLALVAKYESWMDGTVVTLDEDNNIKRFIPSSKFKYEDTESYYKTVNIYKFGKQFSRTHYVPFLEAYSKALGNNEYYEQVLRVIALLDKPEIKALPLSGESWYEIDDIQDLDIAESIFCQPEEKLARMECRCGGYWRYPNVLDFCHLTNPYFPNERMMSELSASFETLIRQYPSGMHITSLLAGKYFGIRSEYVCIGNGATELTKALIERLPGTIGIISPSYEGCPHALSPERHIPFHTAKQDFAYTAKDLMNFYADKSISALAIVNPDNPSGNFIPKSDLLRLCDWAKAKNVRLIINESYVDFTEGSPGNTLLDNNILQAHPHLIVIKSISQSYGVPGLRLGILATGDTALITNMKNAVPAWNINSIAEFYLQIFGKYEKNYREVCQQYIKEKHQLFAKLQKLSFLRPLPSQANYILCEVLPPFTATGLACLLLDKFNILIKNVSAHNDMGGREFIRISVRDEKDHNALINALQSISA